MTEAAFTRRMSGMQGLMRPSMYGCKPRQDLKIADQKEYVDEDVPALVDTDTKNDVLNDAPEKDTKDDVLNDTYSGIITPFDSKMIQDDVTIVLYSPRGSGRTTYPRQHIRDISCRSTLQDDSAIMLLGPRGTGPITTGPNTYGINMRNLRQEYKSESKGAS